MAGSLQKAYLWNVDKKSKVMDVLFNPSEYTFNKSNTWKSDNLTSANVPKPSFQGGGIMTMKFDLFFDTYGVNSDGSSTDVRDYTDKLLELMKIDKDIKQKNSKSRTGRPPIISLHWGNVWGFQGVIKSVGLSFLLFMEDGTPVRAKASVDLQEVDEFGTHYPKQNPTSGGREISASRVVQPGDTLDFIAYQEYGDPTMWRPLARANGLENPRALRPGQHLVVPRL